MERIERITINPIKMPTLRESIKKSLDINLKGALALSANHFVLKIPDIIPCFNIELQPIDDTKHKLKFSTSDVNIDYIITIEKKPNSNYLKVTDIR